MYFPMFMMKKAPNVVRRSNIYNRPYRYHANRAWLSMATNYKLIISCC